MEIRLAESKDLPCLEEHDRHISPKELKNCVELGRVLTAWQGGQFLGWLRWGLFWDEIPFMNMLYLLEGCRGQGTGSRLVGDWEARMKEEGHQKVMTSTMSDETAQHFYRKLHYVDSGALLLKNEALEILFVKELA